jgi:quercetin dioxygenase-like cupin family protein
MKYTDKNAFEKANMFGSGVPNDNYAQYFIGNSFLNFLVKPGESPVFMANVTFEPGCRNNWHIHHAASGGGQILICTAGEGWYQKDGEAPVSLKEGSIAYIPTGVKHWHGAKADSWFSHISVEIPGTDTSNEWLKPVSDDYYDTLEGKG